MTAKCLIASLLTVTLTSGCATLLNSGPSTLDVTVEHPYQGVTTTVTAVATKQSSLQAMPHFQIHLDKSSDYVLTMQSPGYRAEQAVVNRSVHPAFWVDMALLAAPVVALAALILNPGGGEGLGFLLAGVSAVIIPVGIASTAVDMMTNAIWTHDPHQMQVRLIPEPSRP
jgi:hypothetical protein